jgi:hypothetical protein
VRRPSTGQPIPRHPPEQVDHALGPGDSRLERTFGRSSGGYRRSRTSTSRCPLADWCSKPAPCCRKTRLKGRRLERPRREAAEGRHTYGNFVPVRFGGRARTQQAASPGRPREQLRASYAQHRDAVWEVLHPPIGMLNLAMILISQGLRRRVAATRDAPTNELAWLNGVVREVLCGGEASRSSGIVSSIATERGEYSRRIGHFGFVRGDRLDHRFALCARGHRHPARLSRRAAPRDCRSAYRVALGGESDVVLNRWNVCHG